MKQILASVGVSIDRDSLAQTYHERVSGYLDEKGIYFFEDLVELISRGKEYYPTLPAELDEKLLLSTDIVAAQILQNWEAKDIEYFQIFTDCDRSNDVVN